MDVLFILQNTRWNINSSDEYDFLTQRDLTGNFLQCIFSKYMYEIFSSFFDLIFHVRQILKSVAVLTFPTKRKTASNWKRHTRDISVWKRKHWFSIISFKCVADS